LTFATIELTLVTGSRNFVGFYTLSRRSRYSNHGHQADVAIMGAVRGAMDAVGGGDNVLLSTEGFADLYNLHGVSAHPHLHVEIESTGTGSC
jgi:hypothetical protein